MCNYAIGLHQAGFTIPARQQLQQARDIARTYDNARTEILIITAQANIELLRDDRSHALGLAVEAAEKARISGNLTLSRGAYLTLALAQLRMDGIEEALASARAATRYNSRAKAVDAWSVHGLVSFRAEDYYQATTAFQRCMDGARATLIKRAAMTTTPTRR